jgi:hypothetical protein
VISTDNGVTWTADSTRDFNFRAYMQTGFALSGTFVSSLKDANPASGATANWSTLSWNADTPAGTSLQFQVAASNNVNGPFNFIGPDNTASTFFNNGDSLAQFAGNRYLKYQASLATNSNSTTPVLHDVTVCFNNTPASALAVAAASGIFGGTADLSATLTSSGVGLSGKSLAFTLNGNSAGSAITDSSGIATVSAFSLTGINAGTYPGAVAASFAGDSSFSASGGSADLTVLKADQTITFAALAGKSFGDPDFSVSATVSSGLAVTFSATGNCSVLGSTVHLTSGGSCTITASQPGNANFNAAVDVPRSFSISTASQTITFGALTGKIFGDPDFAVSATASSSLTVSFSAAGNCTVTGSAVHITGAGSCTITASQAGDGNFGPAADVPQSFSIAKAGQTITFGALAGKTFGNPDFSVSATSSSGLAVVFGATGSCSVTGSTVHITGAGSCTATATQAGDANFNSAADVPQAFTIGKGSQTITFGALTNKFVGDADFSISATASSSLAVSFVASGVCNVSGSSVHITGAGTCTITASQTGDANFNAATSVPQSFLVANPDFTIAPTLPSVTVKAGQSVTEHITLVPIPATSSAVTFACSGLPALSSCTFTPAAVPAGSPQTDVVLTISTTAATASVMHTKVFYAAWLPFTGIGLFGIVLLARKRSRKAAASFAVLTLILMVLLLNGCGGHATPKTGNPGTPVGTSSVTVTATSLTVTHTTTFSLTVN